MTQRERKLAIILGSGLAVGVVGYGIWWFSSALGATSGPIKKLDQEIADLEGKVKKIDDAAPVLERWRRLSLGSDLRLADTDYKQYLTKKMEGYGFADKHLTGFAETKSTVMHPGKPGKQPIYTALNYTVRFKARLPNLIAFMQDFQKEQRMHRIKSFTIEQSNTKSQSDVLSVLMTFETLSILDAKVATKFSGIPDSQVLRWDTLAFLTKGPNGLAMLGWSLSPRGPKVEPVNPPQTQVRKYTDIARRNFFVGAAKIEDKGFTKPGKPPSDDLINMMRHSYLDLIYEGDGKVEAWLWDRAANLDNQRLKATGGFNKINMIQNAQRAKIVQGTVVKIDIGELVFRVGLVATTQTSSNKWWRYPTADQYYTLHSDDISFLENNGKATAAEKSNLYLINQTYWEKLTGPGDVDPDRLEERIELLPDGSFQFLADFSRGEIVFSDREVVIVRLTSRPPRNAITPAVGARPYPEPTTIYKIAIKHLDELIATKKVQKSEGDRLFVMQTAYWDQLREQKIVRPEGNSFKIYNDLMKGDVVSRTDDIVVFRLAEKYCGVPNDRMGWHQGFCILTVGQSVQDALNTPVSDAEAKKLIKAAGGAD